MIALIDADSIVHIIASQFRDIEVEPASIQEIRTHVDNFIESILTMTKATHYLGAIGTDDRLCFRHESYKYAKYKGNRPPAEEWLVKWRPAIMRRMASYWGFISCSGYEADDIVATLAENMFKRDIDFILCNNDKDSNNVPGKKYNYKKTEDQFTFITPEEANLFFWLQVISGDSGDNVCGVPGLGPVKAAKILKDLEPIQYKSAALQAYCKYFGEYYGPIIFEENYQCIKMGIRENDLEELKEVFIANILPIKEKPINPIFAHL